MGKRKGFPVRLPMTHWLTVRQAYAWLKDIGVRCKEVDDIMHLIPDPRPSEEEITALKNPNLSWKRYMDGTLYSATTRRNKTVRFRSHQVTGAILLLRFAAAFTTTGSYSNTIGSRADDLKRIHPLHLLSDASRDWGIK